MSGTTPTSEVNDLRNQLDTLRAADPVPHVEEAKQKASETISNVASHAADAASQAASQAASAASQAADAVAQPVRQGVEKARAAVRGTAAEVNAQADSLAVQIRGAPVVSLGIAALAGYMIGRIVR